MDKRSFVALNSREPDAMAVPFFPPVCVHSQTVGGKAGDALGREQSCRWMAEPGAFDMQGFDATTGSG